MLSTDQFRRIEERLATLEKNNRSLRLVAIGSAMALGLFLIGGQAKPSPADWPASKTLELEKLVISKPDKKGTITLAIGEHGPFVKMSDETGHTRFDVYAPYDRGPSLRLMDRYGLPRIEGCVDADGPSFRVIEAGECGCETDAPAKKANTKKKRP